MGNRWVIPDIHGCFKTFKSLVEREIGLTKEDTLYLLGDYIDRGENSKEVIDYIIHITEESYNVNYLIGNHEKYCIDAWEADRNRLLGRSRVERDWRKHGAANTLKSFEVNRPRKINQKYIDWMKQGKYYIELEEYVLVHAGLNFKIINPFEDLYSMMWIRDFKVNRDKIGGKKVIHGHIPMELSMINLLRDTPTYGFIALDNGVYYGNSNAGFGNLTAFNLDTKELLVQHNLDL